MGWHFYPLATFVRQGVLVQNDTTPFVAQFLTPAEARAEAKRKAKAA